MSDKNEQARNDRVREERKKRIGLLFAPFILAACARSSLKREITSTQVEAEVRRQCAERDNCQPWWTLGDGTVLLFESGNAFNSASEFQELMKPISGYPSSYNRIQIPEGSRVISFSRADQMDGQVAYEVLRVTADGITTALIKNGMSDKWSVQYEDAEDPVPVDSFLNGLRRVSEWHEPQVLNNLRKSLTTK